jgi:lipid II:glycine glycyltransferase (peptidoglycan interpeptide bridge formation enzyme)
MARFERVNLAPADWQRALSSFPDRIIHQSPAYLAFLAETQNAEPVLAALTEGNETLGYFTGLVFRKFGLKILGSPFRGWSTPYMGFCLQPSVPRRVAVEALPDLAFKELGCIHVEVTDSHMTLEDIRGLGFEHEVHATIVNDLTQSEEALFNNMNNYRRRDIRRAEKHGVVIEEARDEAFAGEFAEQFRDVFAKQGMVPHFGAERVRAFIKHIEPTGALLRLRARDPEGHCLATGLFVGMGPAAFYWAGASWRQYQHLHPNELLQWHAMRYWKRRGMTSYNLAGTMDFKRRFGGAETSTLMIFKSRYRLLSRLRSVAMPLGKAALHLRWKLKRGDGGKPNAPET